MSLNKCVYDKKDSIARFWQSGEVEYLPVNVRTKITRDHRVLLKDFIDSMPGKKISEMYLSGLKIFFAEELPASMENAHPDFYSLDPTVNLKQQVIISASEMKKNAGFFSPLEILTEKMKEWTAVFSDLEKPVLTPLQNLIEKLQKIDTESFKGTNPDLVLVDKAVMIFNSAVTEIEYPLKTTLNILSQLFFNPFLNQIPLRYFIYDSDVQLGKLTEIFKNLSRQGKYKIAKFFGFEEFSKNDNLTKEDIYKIVSESKKERIAPFQSYVGYALQKFATTGVSIESLDDDQREKAPVNDLMKKNYLVTHKLLELGIDSYALGQPGNTYELLILPHFLARHWQDYFRTQVLGISLQSIYMSNAVNPLKTILKNPEKYINPKTGEVKYAEAIMYLKYLKQTVDVVDSFYVKTKEGKERLVTAKNADSFDSEPIDPLSKLTKNETPSALYKFYKTDLSKYSYYQMLEYDESTTNAKDKSPEKLPVSTKTDTLLPKDVEMTILKRRASISAQGQSSIYADRVPFWIDSARTQTWGAVVIDSRKCPFRSKASSYNQFVTENVAYQMGRLILGHMRSSCPTRLSQTSVAYRSDAWRLKNQNKAMLSLYATGFDESDLFDENEKNGDRVEYPTHNQPPQIQSGFMRVLYCVPAGTLAPGTGGLRIIPGYPEVTTVPGSVVKIAEEMPEEVKKSLECAKNTCKIEYKNVARGPLILSKIEVVKPKVSGVDVDVLNESELLSALNNANITIDGRDSINTLRQKLKDLLFKQNSLLGRNFM
jgi:hypothetical protein